ncbi:sigma-54-dependent Fis family transcriptional regulator [Uliginosibacterium sediminicola]|uniref:Sigma-54-dependent Fis family transcriptional regulator n=1 Tax=Uliginosibacterium sediminicola TaxID=2024550 RepID=A0ABU9Z008_9RHOO
MSEKRVSLADVSRETGAVLAARHREQSDESPSLRDITECLFFSPGDGRIWLNDQRMVLMRNSTLGVIRKELIATLGLARARGLLTRVGYAAGARDAELVREHWPAADALSQFMAGTRLHAIEGMVKVEMVRLEVDAQRSSYYGEFLWHNSCEVDEHVAAYGIGNEPACWNLTGYAIGYVSTLFGKLIVFREVECRAAGSRVCRVVGKPAEEWADVEEDLRNLSAESFVSSEVFSASLRSPAQAAELPAASDPGTDGRTQMVGVSAAFNAACHMLRRVAPTQATVLFTGESGVGKELFASMLHEISNRASKPFVSVNCAAIPETLIESELFGVDRGAFTGATVSRPGRFERADGGTLFLDEIGTLSMVSQGKLLRALQEGVIERVGGAREIKVDVRVIAATNVDLQEAVKLRHFRDDLFFRLNVYPIHLPPLRERRDDIPLLLSYFLRRYCQRHGRQLAGFTPRTVRALLNYAYPGNVRELQNLVERGVIAAEDGGLIDITHIFRSEQVALDALYSVGQDGALDNAADAVMSAAEGGEGNLSFLELLLKHRGQDGQGMSLEMFEQRVVEEAVAHTQGNLAAAARLLGMSRAQLAYRMQKP